MRLLYWGALLILAASPPATVRGGEVPGLSLSRTSPWPLTRRSLSGSSRTAQRGASAEFPSAPFSGDFDVHLSAGSARAFLSSEPGRHRFSRFGYMFPVFGNDSWAGRGGFDPDPVDGCLRGASLFATAAADHASSGGELGSATAAYGSYASSSQAYAYAGGKCFPIRVPSASYAAPVCAGASLDRFMCDALLAPGHSVDRDSHGGTDGGTDGGAGGGAEDGGDAAVRSFAAWGLHPSPLPGWSSAPPCLSLPGSAADEVGNGTTRFPGPPPDSILSRAGVGRPLFPFEEDADSSRGLGHLDRADYGVPGASYGPGFGFIAGYFSPDRFGALLGAFGPTAVPDPGDSTPAAADTALSLPGTGRHHSACVSSRLLGGIDPGRHTSPTAESPAGTYDPSLDPILTAGAIAMTPVAVADFDPLSPSDLSVSAAAHGFAADGGGSAGSFASDWAPAGGFRAADSPGTLAGAGIAVAPCGPISLCGYDSVNGTVLWVRRAGRRADERGERYRSVSLTTANTTSTSAAAAAAAVADRGDWGLAIALRTHAVPVADIPGGGATVRGHPAREGSGGSIDAVRLDDGAAVWSVSGEFHDASSVTITPDATLALVICAPPQGTYGASDGPCPTTGSTSTLVAVNLTDGSRAWSAQVPNATGAAVVTEMGTAVVASFAPAVFSVNLTSPHAVSVFDIDAGLLPCAGDTDASSSSSDDHLGPGGGGSWGVTVGPSSETQGVVYLSCGCGVAAVEFGTGDVAWSAVLGVPVSGAPVVAAGATGAVLVARAADGTAVFGVDSSDGSLVWAASPGTGAGAQPVDPATAAVPPAVADGGNLVLVAVAGGIAFVRASDGEEVCGLFAEVSDGRIDGDAPGWSSAQIGFTLASDGSPIAATRGGFVHRVPAGSLVSFDAHAYALSTLERPLTGSSTPTGTSEADGPAVVLTGTGGGAPTVSVSVSVFAANATANWTGATDSLLAPERSGHREVVPVDREGLDLLHGASPSQPPLLATLSLRDPMRSAARVARGLHVAVPVFVHAPEDEPIDGDSPWPRGSGAGTRGAANERHYRRGAPFLPPWDATLVAEAQNATAEDAARLVSGRGVPLGAGPAWSTPPLSGIVALPRSSVATSFHPQTRGAMVLAACAANASVARPAEGGNGVRVAEPESCAYAAVDADSIPASGPAPPSREEWRGTWTGWGVEGAGLVTEPASGRSRVARDHGASCARPRLCAYGASAGALEWISPELSICSSGGAIHVAAGTAAAVVSCAGGWARVDMSTGQLLWETQSGSEPDALRAAACSCDCSRASSSLGAPPSDAGSGTGCDEGGCHRSCGAYCACAEAHGPHGNCTSLSPCAGPAPAAGAAMAEDGSLVALANMTLPGNGSLVLGRAVVLDAESGEVLRSEEVRGVSGSPEISSTGLARFPPAARSPHAIEVPVAAGAVRGNASSLPRSRSWTVPFGAGALAWRSPTLAAGPSGHLFLTGPCAVWAVDPVSRTVAWRSADFGTRLAVAPPVFSVAEPASRDAGEEPTFFVASEDADVVFSVTAAMGDVTWIASPGPCGEGEGGGNAEDTHGACTHGPAGVSRVMVSPLGFPVLLSRASLTVFHPGSGDTVSTTPLPTMDPPTGASLLHDGSVAFTAASGFVRRRPMTGAQLSAALAVPRTLFSDESENATAAGVALPLPGSGSGPGGGVVVRDRHAAAAVAAALGMHRLGSHGYGHSDTEVLSGALHDDGGNCSAPPPTLASSGSAPSSDGLGCVCDTIDGAVPCECRFACTGSCGTGIGVGASAADAGCAGCGCGGPRGRAQELWDAEIAGATAVSPDAHVLGNGTAGYYDVGGILHRAVAAESNASHATSGNATNATSGNATTSHRSGLLAAGTWDGFGALPIQEGEGAIAMGSVLVVRTGESLFGEVSLNMTLRAPDGASASTAVAAADLPEDVEVALDSTVVAAGARAGAPFAVRAVDDPLIEGAEAARATITVANVTRGPASCGPGGVRDWAALVLSGAFSASSSAVDIVVPESDLCTVRFAPPYTTPIVRESGGNVSLTLVRDPAGVRGALNVSVSLSGITADGPFVDFGPGAFLAPFGFAEDSVVVSIPILDDPLAEGIEMFAATISSVRGPAGAPVTAPAPGTLGASINITINASDPFGVQWSTTVHAVNESVGAATLRIDRTAGVSGAFSVDVVFADLSASGAGLDYNSTTQTVVFGAGEASRTVEVGIVDDTLAEGEEAFTATLTNLVDASGQGAILGRDVATVVIGASDPFQVNFAAAEYHVSESVGAANLTIHRTPAGTTGAFSVAVTFGGGSATGGGVDYNSTAQTVVFGPGEASRTVLVDITDDGVLEGDEFFIAALGSMQDASGQGSIVDPAAATLTIRGTGPLVRVHFEPQHFMSGSGTVKNLGVLGSASDAQIIGCGPDPLATHGPRGHAVSFRGNASACRVEIPAPVSESFIGEPWTVAFWFRFRAPPGNTSDGQVLVHRGDADGSWETGESIFYVAKSPPHDAATEVAGTVGFVTEGFDSISPGAGTTPNDTAWHHYAFAGGPVPGTGVAYVDGLAVASMKSNDFPGSAFPSAPSDPVAGTIRLGGIPSFPATHVASSAGADGEMDDFVWFRRALSAEEIAFVMSEHDLRGVDGVHCGNAQLETGEECDDGNVLSGDGCDRHCYLEMDCALAHFPCTFVK